MEKKPMTVLDRAKLAIETAVKLVGQFNDGTCADPARTNRLFARLRLLILGLPPTQHLSPTFADNMIQWPRIWESGGFNAARLQVLLLIRKLSKYRDDWSSGGTLAVLKPTPPTPVTTATGT
jgi:hypothetical protein